MKIKFLILITATLAALFSHAEKRERYSVTGTAEDTGFAYESTICSWATTNAQSKASQVCFEEGFNNGWTHASYGECSNRLFSSDKKIKMTFYCY